MVKYSELKSILESSGIPAEEYHLEDYKPQEISVPVLIYTMTNKDDFSADGKSYLSMLRVQIELLTYDIGFEERALVEKAMNDANLNFSSTNDFDNNASLYFTIYTVTVLEG